MKKRILILAIILMGFISISITSPVRNHRVDLQEENLIVEEWMTHPFTNFIEEPLEIEEWMTKPFLSN